MKDTTEQSNGNDGLRLGAIVKRKSGELADRITNYFRPDKTRADYVWTKKERRDHSEKVMNNQYLIMRRKGLAFIDSCKNGTATKHQEDEFEYERRIYHFYLNEYLNASMSAW